MIAAYLVINVMEKKKSFQEGCKTPILDLIYITTSVHLWKDNKVDNMMQDQTSESHIRFGLYPGFGRAWEFSVVVKDLSS